MRVSYLSTSLALLSIPSVNAQWPTDKNSAIVRELEHLALDGLAHNLKSMISPCSQYLDSSTGSVNTKPGRQTAAEWVRTTFHDFITGNQYTYVGGLDASIGFETGRAENVGTAFNDALTNFGYYFSARVSMADLISLGTMLVAGHCGGSPVTMRGGRVDATAAGPTGVPQPQDGLQKQLTQFGNVGFNTDDTIALTLCGHTLGGVHEKDFPDVTKPVGTVDGTDLRVVFDSSSSTFDTNVAKEYIAGTGNKGGPLVTTTNVTVQSDLRLYEADGNATVQRIASNGQDYFNTQCSSLFQRMIETVPTGVMFTTAINPTSSSNLKPYNVDLNIGWNGQMTLIGYLRYIQVPGSAAAPASYTVKLIGRNGQTTSTQATATKSAADSGTGLFGPTYSYKFQLTFPATTGTKGISVGGTTFTFQDSMFVVPGLSSISPAPPAFVPAPSMNSQTTYSANLTVAYYSSSPPKTLAATFSIPVTQTGTVSPKIDTSTKSTLNLIGKVGGYGIYSGKTSKSLSGKQVYGMSVDVADGSNAGGLGFYKVARY